MYTMMYQEETKQAETQPHILATLKLKNNKQGNYDQSLCKGFAT